MNSRRKSGMKKRSINQSTDDPFSQDAVAAAVIKKNPIHSVLTALPVIMLVCGLWFYFSGEKQQRTGELILSEMITVSGEFSGMSEQSKKPHAQRIIWIKTPERLRGGRLDRQQFRLLQALQKEQSVQLWLAPRVAGSNLLWVAKAQAGGQVFFDLTEN